MNTYVVTNEKRKFIERNFFEWSFKKSEDFLPEKALFQKLDHPAELHYLAGIYNWDDGPVVLEWLLDSPLCTRATANLIFWRAAPDWYLRCDIDDELSCPDFNRDAFKVIRKIVQKYKDCAFSSYEIEFDPTNEIEEVIEKNPRWSFPKGVYDTIKGIKVLVED